MCLNQQNCNRLNIKLLFNNLVPVNFKMYTNIALIHPFIFIQNGAHRYQVTVNYREESCEKKI